MGVEATAYSTSFVEAGRVWVRICTVTVSKKHVTAVTLNSSPETVRERFAEYQRVCEALVLNVK